MADRTAVFDGNSDHESREKAREYRRGEGHGESHASLAEQIGESLEQAASAARLDAGALADALRNPDVARAAIAAIVAEMRRNAPVVVPPKRLQVFARRARRVLRRRGITMSFYKHDLARLPKSVATEDRLFTPVILTYDRIVTDAEVRADMEKRGAVRCHEAFLQHIGGALRKGVWVSHGVGETLVEVTNAKGASTKRDMTLLYDVTGDLNLLHLQTIGPYWNPGTTFVGWIDVTPQKPKPAADADAAASKDAAEAEPTKA